jgi:murein DD-endopeptidase MepM/ murein hydrolase activator NlpD
LRRHRTTARGILLLILFGLAAPSAAAWPGPPEPWKPQPVAPPKQAEPKAPEAPKQAAAKDGVPRLIFPVVGPSTYTDDFGDARGNGSHEGNDIMAPRRAQAVAAEAGTVKFHTTSWRAGCMLYLHGRSGTEYLYVHLNNDRGNGNDNKGGCVAGTAYAPGLKDGARVAAGEPIGYVGDSGDADGIHPHLHFEVHPKGGGATSPYRHLRRAQKLLFAAKPGTVVDLTLDGTVLGAGQNALTLKVDRLQLRPLDFSLSKVGRTVEVSLPPTATVFNALGTLISTARLASMKPGADATVTTEPGEATIQAQLGAPGALLASTVRLDP